MPDYVGQILRPSKGRYRIYVQCNGHNKILFHLIERKSGEIFIIFRSPRFSHEVVASDPAAAVRQSAFSTPSRISLQNKISIHPTKGHNFYNVLTWSCETTDGHVQRNSGITSAIKSVSSRYAYLVSRICGDMSGDHFDYRPRSGESAICIGRYSSRRSTLFYSILACHRDQAVEEAIFLEYSNSLYFIVGDVKLILLSSLIEFSSPSKTISKYFTALGGYKPILDDGNIVDITEYLSFPFKRSSRKQAIDDLNSSLQNSTDADLTYARYRLDIKYLLEEVQAEIFKENPHALINRNPRVHGLRPVDWWQFSTSTSFTM